MHRDSRNVDLNGPCWGAINLNFKVACEHDGKMIVRSRLAGPTTGTYQRQVAESDLLRVLLLPND